MTVKQLIYLLKHFPEEFHVGIGSQSKRKTLSERIFILDNKKGCDIILDSLDCDEPTVK